MTDSELPPPSAGHPEPDEHPHAAPVVGIGASAGGLEALTELLQGIPKDTGMAFVVVQHLDPEHESLLVDILGRVASLPVEQVSDHTQVEANHVYIIPPNTTMTISGGELNLAVRRITHGQHMPIDAFFRSLAVEPTRKIAVLLSGSGTDGSLGMQEIKAAGGITFAQEPSTAKFDAMPRSAIFAACVDFILPPALIAQEIVRISQAPVFTPPAERRPLEIGERDGFTAILNLLRTATAVDFSMYRRNTVHRRILRRMALCRIESVAQYAEYVRGHDDELANLYRDLLIKVTGFFRDAEVFEALKHSVFPGLLESKSSNDTLRIWVPGCSTGEEVYSLAICLLETAGDRIANTQVQFFGTDLSDVALEHARIGCYVENIEADVSPERLRRFFVKRDAQYQISKTIRDMCIFARQNIARDPAFSRLDLISCRNVLIYLESALQRRIIPIFHYALRPGGFLVLGRSESVGDFGNLFLVEDRANKIYSKLPSPTPLAIDFGGAGFAYEALGARQVPDNRNLQAAESRVALQREADRALMNRYVPAGVLVDQNFDIHEFRGQTGRYLEPAAGEPTHNLLKMAREGLMVDLHGAIKQAQDTNTPVRQGPIPVKQNGGVVNVEVEVIPVRAAAARQRYFWVTFRQPEPAPEGPPAPAPAAAEAESLRTRELERALEANRQYLQSVIEQQEATTEELKSANEEILSSNEELQSTNEELQTAKEELQSANEELTTVNEELQHRNAELTAANDDMNNLVNGVGIPMLMVSRDLSIRRFTPQAAQCLNIIPSDVGRPLHDIRLNITAPDFEHIIRRSIDQVAPQERELQDLEGHWYVMRVRPYITVNNVIDGAVIVFLDVDAVKGGLEELRGWRTYAEAAVDVVGEPFLVLDTELRAEPNTAFYRTFGLAAAQAKGQPLDQVGPGWLPPELATLLHEVIANDRAFTDVEITHDFPRIGVRTVLVSARAVAWGRSDARRVLLALKDVTELRRTNDVMQALDRERADRLAAETATRAKDEFLAELSHELRSPLQAMVTWIRLLRRGAGDDETVRRAVEALERSVASQSALIDDLLDVSRIISGKLRLSVVPIDVAPVITAAVERVRAAATDAGVQLQVDIEPNTPPVLGDVLRLEQVVINLLSNAIKFSRRDAAVQVRVRREDHSVAIAVGDSGVGMAPEMLPHVFDRFRQGAAALPSQGLGLGLTIVKHLVELHGGTVEAASDGLGKGATFTVRLPVTSLRMDETEAERVRLIIERNAVESPDLRGIRVLLVDDDHDGINALRMMLAMFGADVVSATSVRQAFEQLQRRRCDVIVSDIAMPDEDGFALIKRLRQLPPAAGGSMPAIALTVRARPDDAARVLSAGFQRHLGKPFDPNAVAQAIRELVRPPER